MADFRYRCIGVCLHLYITHVRASSLSEKAAEVCPIDLSSTSTIAVTIHSKLTNVLMKSSIEMISFGMFDAG